jgi:RHS repeat-associated protein
MKRRRVSLRQWLGLERFWESLLMWSEDARNWARGAVRWGVAWFEEPRRSPFPKPLRPAMEGLEERQLMTAETVQWEYYGYPISEGAGFLTVYAVLADDNGNDGADQQITIDYATSDLNSDPDDWSIARAGYDYTANIDSVIIPQGETRSDPIEIELLQDDVDEYIQYFQLSITSVTGADPVSPTIALLSILDDDPLPKVEFTQAHYKVTENAGPGIGGLVMDRMSEKGDIVVTFTTAGCGCGGAAGGFAGPDTPAYSVNAPDPLDYTLALDDVDFPKGEWIATIPLRELSTTFSVGVFDDLLEEGPEDIQLRIKETSELAVPGLLSASRMVIIDNEATFTWSGGSPSDLLSVSFSGNTTMTWGYTSHRVTTFTDQNNKTTTYSYDANGRISAITDPSGVVTNYVVNASGRLTSRTMANTGGGTSTTNFSYDGYGRLTGITHPNSTQETFTYDSSGNPLTHVNGLGITATFDYPQTETSAAPRYKAVRDATGLTTTYTFDDSGKIESIEDPTGSVTSFEYDSYGHITSRTEGSGTATTYYGYNAAGQVTTVTNPLGFTTTTTYQSDGRVSTIQNADLTRTTFVYDDANRKQTELHPDGTRTTTVFDAQGHVLNTYVPSGAITTFLYDSVGRQTAVISPGETLRATTIFDNAGRVSGTIDVYGQRTTNTYDARGRLLSVDDINGGRTTYVYDSLDRQIAVIDRYGQRATTTYDAAGRVSWTQDVYGNRTTFQYDSAGRQTEVWNLNGRTTTVYDNGGRVQATVDLYGNRTSYSYDGMNRQTQVAAPFNRITTTLYDAAGQVTEVQEIYGSTYGRTTFAYDSVGHRTGMTDVYGNRTTYQFDTAGRPNVTTDIYGHATTTTYNANGQVTSVQNVFGDFTTYVYDSIGRVIETQETRNGGIARTTTVFDTTYNRVSQTIDAQGNRATTIYEAATGRVLANVTAVRSTVSGSLVEQRVSFHYDTYGHLDATQDARGFRTTTVYDSTSDRVIATINALGQRTTTLYDAQGRYLATQNALGHRTTVVYDSNGRQQATIDPLNHRTTTLYDSQGRYQATQDATGYRATVGYDSYGRQSMTHNLIDSAASITTVLYDNYGRAEVNIDPLGNRTTTVFDSFGRQSATIDARNGRTTIGYDAYGRQNALTDPQGNTTTSTYDSLGQLIQSQDPLSNSATFAYDNLGRLSSTTDRDGRRREFTYDEAGRKLQEVWYQAGTTVADSALTFTYDSNGNQLTAWNGAGIQTMVYDALNRVSRVEQIAGAGATMTFTYDAVGHRILVQDNFGGVESSTYDAAGNLTQRRRYDKEPVTITGTLFNDLNGDGIKNGSDTYLSGLTVVLYAAGTSTVLTQSTTNGSGAFSLSTTQDGYAIGISTSSYTLATSNTLTFPTTTVTTFLSETLNGNLSGVNFGLSSPTTPVASGTIFSDTDGDGVKDAGENGISGVSVTLSTGGSTSTNGSGQYSIVAPKGPYTVSFSYSGGDKHFSYANDVRWTNTSGTSATSAEYQGGSSLTVGLNTIATVTAHYYSDSNGNGTQDGGESNLSGITVSVYLTDGTLVKTLTTDASGNAVFAAPPGPYNVAFAAPSGKYLPVNSGYQYFPSATYGMGGTRSGSASWNVGLLTGTPSYSGTSGTGNVTGRLFTDSNSNGVYDGTDTILSGITVNLYKYDGTNLTLDQTTTTNGSGNFTLNSPDKTYYLEFTGVSGEFYFGSSTEIRWTNLAGTTAVTGSHTGTKAFGDVGVKPATTMPTVSGYVFDDANGNGSKDGGESYLSGVAVTVYPFGRTSGGVSGTTSAGGYYSITAPASAYQVQFTAPTGKYIPLNDGTATTVLGWASVAGAVGTSETLEGTSSLDVGMRGGGTATTVNLFDDLNGNGNYNSGSETYLSGIAVSLYAAGTSTIVATATTDASGNVSFPTYPGKYELRYATAPIGRVFPQNVDLGWTASDGRTATGAIMSGATSTSIAIRQADDTPPFIGTARSDFTYDDANYLKSEVRYYNFAGTPVVARTTITYDGSHKVKQIKTIDAKTSPTTLADYQYSYDASGRVTVQNDNGTRTTYAYDATNQVTGEDFATGTDGAYSYDLGGNRTMAGYATGTDNRITGDGTYTFTYFNEGMLKEKTKVGTSEKWNYFYDNANHLTKIERKTNGSAVDLRVLYTYDANGSRVQSSVDLDGDGINNATVTKYMLDGWNPAILPSPSGRGAGGEGLVEVYSDLGDDGSLKTRYLRGDKVDQLLARVEHTGDHAGTYWYLTDNLGSIRKVIDAGASIKDAISYDAYGNIISETDSSYRGRYAWTGREIEVEAKLQYNRARYYDPSIGRWIAKDPIGFDAGDSNLYRYVNNAPTNYGDPSGFSVQQVPLHSNSASIEHGAFRRKDGNKFADFIDLTSKFKIVDTVENNLNRLAGRANLGGVLVGINFNHFEMKMTLKGNGKNRPGSATNMMQAVSRGDPPPFAGAFALITRWSSFKVRITAEITPSAAFTANQNSEAGITWSLGALAVNKNDDRNLLTLLLGKDDKGPISKKTDIITIDKKEDIGAGRILEMYPIAFACEGQVEIKTTLEIMSVGRQRRWNPWHPESPD